MPLTIDDLKKWRPLVFLGLSFLSLPLAVTAVRCHSYAQAPVRFALDMLLRSLLIVLPFILACGAFGFCKKAPWAARLAVYAGVVFGIIVACMVVLMI